MDVAFVGHDNYDWVCVIYLYTYVYIHIYIYIVNTCRIIQYIYITSRSSSIEGIISTSFICDDPFYCGNDIDES